MRRSGARAAVVPWLTAALAMSGVALVTPAHAEPQAALSSPAASVGSLRVTITGLPTTVRAKTTVTGPRGFSRSITHSILLTGLTPGTYTVASTSIPVAKGRLIAAPTTRAFVVTAGSSTAAAVLYRFVGQPVTVKRTVNGKVDGLAIVNRPAVVALTVTNASRQRAVSGFTIVVPADVPRVSSVRVSGHNGWTAAVAPCGTTPRCSARIVVRAASPARLRSLRTRESVTVTVGMKAPATPGVRRLRLADISNGYFTVLGPEAEWRTAKGEVTVGTPSVPITSTQLPPIAVGTSTVSAGLSNGAYGPVSLYYVPIDCPAGFASASCATATLDGTFSDPKDPNGHLYSNSAPASMTVTCTSVACPSPLGPNFDFDAVAEYNAWPLNVSLKVNGVYQPFGAAPPCYDLNPGGLRLTGQLYSPAAQAAGYCMDVWAMSRDVDQTLTRTILFVEDPKLTPISRR